MSRAPSWSRSPTATEQIDALVCELYGCTLAVIVGGAVFLYGSDVIEHPLLAVFILLAWLGALAGIGIGSDPGRV